MKSRWISLLVVVLAACQPPAPPVALNVGVLPDRSHEALERQYAPLLRHLEHQTGLALTLVIEDDYASFLDAFVNGDLDLAWFGGMTFAEAERRVGAEPLVMRDTDVAFRSCYIVQADDDRQALESFRDTRFAFGSKLSTSGHVMPRYFMRRKSIEPEAFFDSVEYAPDHEQTIYRVRDARADIGVVNCIIYESLVAANEISGLKVLETSPPYADYVWAVQASLDEGTRIRLREAFLSLDASDAAHLALLRAQGANAYLPAGRSDFDDVRRAAQATGLFGSGL